MLTEINIGRFFTTIYFFTKAGLNMPAIYRDLALEGRHPKLERKRNPLPTGLAWVRGMDVEPPPCTERRARSCRSRRRARGHRPRARDRQARMTLDDEEERNRIERISSDSWYAEGASGAAVKYCTNSFTRHWRGGRCLELGPAEGLMTEALISAFDHVELVEGSKRFCVDLAQRFPSASVHHSLFEAYEPNTAFDAIVLGHVLEHVENPRDLLARAGRWLAPGRRV